RRSIPRTARFVDPCQINVDSRGGHARPMASIDRRPRDRYRGLESAEAREVRGPAERAPEADPGSDSAPGLAGAVAVALGREEAWAWARGRAPPWAADRAIG